ncbi:MAG TPA: serine/threonine-protein kinase [Gemmatales bacterium]|nr:serine/threonine-protein kinase [Gemmatales bacterium]
MTERQDTKPSVSDVVSPNETTAQEVPKTMVISNLEVVVESNPKSAVVSPEFQKIGPYQIVKVIGFGGVGTVYEAVDSLLNRPVALKVLNKKWLDDEVVKERFLREAKLCTMIKSPHVPLMHMVGEENGVPYLAMELLQGFTLDDLMKTSHQFTIPQIIRLGREIAKGLSAAHAMRLIHRDIKPTNIWLETMADPSGADRKMFRVKILDFGMARLQEQTQGLTRAGVIVGTPLYMSPEQASGGKVDARSDIFSLGVVLYRLCTGKLPFGGESIADVISNISTQQVPAVHEITPHIPKKLSKLISRMMMKNPADRPPDAMNVARLLEIMEEEFKVMTAVKPAAPPAAPAPVDQPKSREKSDDVSLPTEVLSPFQNPIKPWFIASVILNVVLLLILMFLLGSLLKIV